MKRVYFVSMLLLVLSSAVMAQNVTKQVVNVEPFTFSDQFSRYEAKIVRGNVISSLQKTNRVVVVDLEQQSAVHNEAERRKAESSMNDDHAVNEIVQLKANNILKGNLISIQNREQSGISSITGKPYRYWYSTLNFTIQLIDPSTGATVQSFDYKSTGSSELSAKDAREKAIRSSTQNMDRFVEDAFPVKGMVVMVEKGNEKTAKTVYINLGTDQGVEVDQKFIVYKVKDVAGAKAEQEVGEIIAIEVLGSNRTLCKVKSGGDVIATTLANNGEISIKTYTKKKH